MIKDSVIKRIFGFEISCVVNILHDTIFHKKYLLIFYYNYYMLTVTLSIIKLDCYIRPAGDYAEILKIYI